ncbi:MAG: hypothetical protein HYV04_00865 [Deltaproteobacteria bacterium]|nr:hypothetical protein [Deltaproteobacteria bacterium]
MSIFQLRRGLSFAPFLVTLLFAARAFAQPAPSPKSAFDEKAVADFYRGKTIRIVIGSAPGGIYDIYSRLMARHMPRYIPGNPTIIIEPKAGAGGLIAANSVYNAESKDGTVIGSFGETFVLRQALGAPGIEFDSAKYQWIGSAISTAVACVARTDSGVASFRDVIEGKPLTMGTMAPGSAIYDTPAIINAALGNRMKLVRGFRGVADIVLATEGKEVDGYCAAWQAMLTTGRHPRLLKDGTIKVIVIMGDKTPDHPFLKGVPAAETLAQTEEARQLLRTMHAPSRIYVPYAVAPEVPKDRVEALRKAFSSTYADPEFQTDAKKTGGIEFTPSTGEQVTKVVQSILSTPPAVLARMKKVLIQ